MYANSGSPKKPRTICGRRCRRRSRAVTTDFICSGPLGAAGATPSRLTFFHTHSSGLSCGEEAGSRCSRSAPSVELTKRSSALARWAGWLSTMQNTGPAPVRWASCSSRFRKAMTPAAVSVPASTENRRAPCALIAEIMFSPNRAPVARTAGVCPTGAQVVPAWSSLRTPASSTKNTVPPAALAAAAIAGYLGLLPAGHRRRVGLLGPVERPLGGAAQGVQRAPDAGHGKVHAEPGGDQLPDHLAGPQRDGEAVLARIGLGDQPGQLAQLLLGERARPAGHWLC